MVNFFSKNLRYLRKSNGLTLIDLSKSIGIPVNSITKYEKEVNIPSINVLLKFCDYFKVTPNDMLCLEIDTTGLNKSPENINNFIEEQSDLLKSKNDTIKALQGQIALYEKLLKEKED